MEVGKKKIGNKGERAMETKSVTKEERKNIKKERNGERRQGTGRETTG
jgi:hypothetical protein